MLQKTIIYGNSAWTQTGPLPLKDVFVAGGLSNVTEDNNLRHDVTEDNNLCQLCLAPHGGL